jgi:hypothetical protein
MPLLQDDFFKLSYLDGSNTDYTRNFSIEPLLELKFTDIELSSPENTSNPSIFSSGFMNSLPLPKTANYSFRFDNTICGDSNQTWIEAFDQGQCNDKRWYPRFIINSTSS